MKINAKFPLTSERTYSNTSRKIKFLFFLMILSLGLAIGNAPAQVLYSNSGDNTTGFTTGYADGAPTIVSNGTDIIESNGGRWDFLPVTVTGDFQISFQVESLSTDGDSHFMLINPSTYSGLDVRNSPQSTDTPNINIFSGTDFTNYNQYFFPTSQATLATATSTSFPNMAWTQVTITRIGNVITDNVGGQIIQANVASQNLSTTLNIGLGGYSDHGQVLYRNIVVTAPEPSAISLLSAGFFIVLAAVWKQKKAVQSDN